jgi:hypothetical protein
LLFGPGRIPCLQARNLMPLPLFSSRRAKLPGMSSGATAPVAKGAKRSGTETQKLSPDRCSSTKTERTRAAAPLRPVDGNAMMGVAAGVQEGLELLPRRALQALAKKYGVKANGKSVDVSAAILEHQQQHLLQQDQQQEQQEPQEQQEQQAPSPFIGAVSKASPVLKPPRKKKGLKTPTLAVTTTARGSATGVKHNLAGTSTGTTAAPTATADAAGCGLTTFTRVHTLFSDEGHTITLRQQFAAVVQDKNKLHPRAVNTAAAAGAAAGAAVVRGGTDDSPALGHQPAPQQHETEYWPWLVPVGTTHTAAAEAAVSVVPNTTTMAMAAPAAQRSRKRQTARKQPPAVQLACTLTGKRVSSAPVGQGGDESADAGTQSAVTGACCGVVVLALSLGCGGVWWWWWWWW